MAYDKVVDSGKLETGLTTIADAIRAKGGTSAPLEFPQGMADAVAAISGGGGKVQTASGEYVLASDSRSMSIDISNIGFIPDYAVVQLVGDDVQKKTAAFCMWYAPELLGIAPFPPSDPGFKDVSYTNMHAVFYGENDIYNGRWVKAASEYIGTFLESPIGIQMTQYVSAYPIRAGTYKWTVCKFRGG